MSHVLLSLGSLPSNSSRAGLHGNLLVLLCHALCRMANFLVAHRLQPSSATAKMAVALPDALLGRSMVCQSLARPIAENQRSFRYEGRSRQCQIHPRLLCVHVFGSEGALVHPHPQACGSCGSPERLWRILAMVHAMVLSCPALAVVGCRAFRPPSHGHRRLGCIPRPLVDDARCQTWHFGGHAGCRL